jgi:chromosome segregation ATPase
MAEEFIGQVIGSSAFEQVEKMLALLEKAGGQIQQINAVVAGVSLEIKGAKTVEDLATKTVKLQENTEALKKSTFDYNAIAAKTEQVLKEVSGSQAENLRMYAQYKAELAKNREEQAKLDKELKKGIITTAEYKTAVAGLVQQEQQAKLAQSELSATIKAGIKEQQASAGSIDQMAQRLGQLKDAYRRMSEAERESSGGEALLKSIQQLDPAVKNLNASTGNFQANVGNYSQTFNSATAVLRTTREELMKQRVAAEEGSDAYNAINTQIRQLDSVLESNATKLINARQAQKALREVSVELASTLGVESEAFRAVTELAGGYADQIGDVQAVINQSASDTQGLDEIIGAAEGLAGAFGVAQSTAVLFGASEEEVKKSTEKLMAVMTVLQSLQAVQNALQSESSAIAFVNTARTKALAGWMDCY